MTRLKDWQTELLAKYDLYIDFSADGQKLFVHDNRTDEFIRCDMNILDDDAQFIAGFRLLAKEYDVEERVCVWKEFWEGNGTTADLEEISYDCKDFKRRLVSFTEDATLNSEVSVSADDDDSPHPPM